MMFKRTCAFPVLFIVLVSCKAAQNEVPSVETPSMPPAFLEAGRMEVKANVPEPSARSKPRCKEGTSHELEGHGLRICSQYGIINQTGESGWSGTNIVIFKKDGKAEKVLRDFSETYFGAEFGYGVDVETKEKNILITVYGDSPPDWKAEPLFLEILDPLTETAIIRPLVEVPRSYSGVEVERMVSELEGNMEDLHVKDMGEFFILVYRNLFSLRAYAFHRPSDVSTAFKRLDEWDWNDGEVSETLSLVANTVSYMEGKKIEIE